MTEREIDTCERMANRLCELIEGVVCDLPAAQAKEVLELVGWHCEELAATHPGDS